MIDASDNVIDFGTARLRQQASEAGKADEPAKREPTSSDEIVSFITGYLDEPDDEPDLGE